MDGQEEYPWDEGYQSISIKAKYTDNNKRLWKGCSFDFNVVGKERFRKYYLSEMKEDQENTFGDFYQDVYLVNGSYSKYYQFTPDTNGKYNFETSVTKHNDKCSVTVEYIVYQDGQKVSNDQRLDAGKEYIIKFYGKHSNTCESTDLKSLKPTIKVTKVAPDKEPTTEIPPTTTTEAPTTTTEAPTTTTEARPTTTTAKPNTPPKDTSNKPSSTTASNKKENTIKPVTPTVKQPSGSKIKKVNAAKKALTITWTKVKGIKGYEIWLATDKKFKKNRKIVLVGNPKTTKKTVKKLKAKKKYYVRIRTYKKVGFKKVYSKWLNVKSAETK